MIWATVSSWSCFCWLYRASPSLAAKNIINLISVLTIWWCPRVESSGPLDSIKSTLLLMTKHWPLIIWYPAISITTKNLSSVPEPCTLSPCLHRQPPLSFSRTTWCRHCPPPCVHITLVDGVCSRPSPGHYWLVVFLLLHRSLLLAQSPLIVSDISLHCLSCSSASQRLLLWDATLPKLLSLILEIH